MIPRAAVFATVNIVCTLVPQSALNELTVANVTENKSKQAYQDLHHNVLCIN